MERKVLLIDTKILITQDHIQLIKMIRNPKTFCNNLLYKNDSMFIEGVSCEKIGRSLGTPIYCYSTQEIKSNYENFKKSISEFDSMICYAVKANFNKYIISLLAELGSGADVVSKGEIKLALSSGIKPEKIVFSGVGKTKKEISYAIKKKIYQINVESIEELKEIEDLIKEEKVKKRIDISLRINPDVDANTHKKISTGRYEDKFGIPYHRVTEIFKKYKDNRYINLCGLAIHIGSQITDIKPFDQAFHKLRMLIISLKDNGSEVSRIDLGGGIGIVYSNNSTISFDDYRDIIKKNFFDLNLKIIFEPGRSLVGSAGILVSKVIRNKKGEVNDFLIIDCGMNNLIRPSMYDSYHEIFPVILKKNEIVDIDIVGPICESSDVFGKKRKIEKMVKEELLVLCSVGAYGSCMSSNYNCRDVAKEVFIDGKKIMDSNGKRIKLSKG